MILMQGFPDIWKIFQGFHNSKKVKKCCFKLYTFIIKGFQTITFISIVTSTMFRPICILLLFWNQPVIKSCSLILKIKFWKSVVVNEVF